MESSLEKIYMEILEFSFKFNMNRPLFIVWVLAKLLFYIKWNLLHIELSASVKSIDNH